MSAKGNAITNVRNKRAGSVEWYTPPGLLAHIADFLGADYYDPCPARNGKALDVNGLAVSWANRRLYVNPPYGRAITPWIRKAMTEPVDELILLVPAYTDTRWFAPLFEHSICFIRGRLSFRRPDAHGGKAWPAPHASALIYRGPRVNAFVDHFAEIGPVMRQHYPMASAQPELWGGIAV